MWLKTGLSGLIKAEATFLSHSRDDSRWERTRDKTSQAGAGPDPAKGSHLQVRTLCIPSPSLHGPRFFRQARGGSSGRLSHGFSSRY